MSDAPPLVPNPFFLLDYDGTLAPIVRDPARAFPHPDVPDLLTRLSERYPLRIVTGRHLGSLEALLPGLALPALGLHGAQDGVLGQTTATAALSDAAREGLAQMRARVPDLEGVRVEEKGPTFAVHYRNAPDPEAAAVRLRRWAQDLTEGLEAVWGKCVVELRPTGTNKGTAITRLLAAYPNHTPLYLGDDVTDEDAFRALDDQAVTIKVGDGDTHARYRLADVEAVVAYLRQYLF